MSKVAFWIIPLSLVDIFENVTQCDLPQVTQEEAMAEIRVKPSSSNPQNEILNICKHAFLIVAVDRESHVGLEPRQQLWLI